MQPTIYAAYGLNIASDISLPELEACADGARVGAADVVVRVGRALAPGSFDAPPESFRADSETAQVAWPDAGRFSILSGREVLIEPVEGVPEESLRLILLGPVLAILLFQRGFLVLHASAAALPDARGEWGAVAFVGHSGAGKSTMAAALHARGWPVVADDCLAVPPPLASAGREPTLGQWPLVFPGFARLRLWPRSLAALGREDSPHPPGWKGALSVAAGFTSGALPLRRVYVLEVGEGIGISRVGPGRSVVELGLHSYCTSLLAPEERAAQFQRCGPLAAAIPLQVLSRPRDLARLDEVARAVEEDQAR